MSFHSFYQSFKIHHIDENLSKHITWKCALRFFKLFYSYVNMKILIVVWYIRPFFKLQATVLRQHVHKTKLRPLWYAAKVLDRMYKRFYFLLNCWSINNPSWEKFVALISSNRKHTSSYLVYQNVEIVTILRIQMKQRYVKPKC